MAINSEKVSVQYNDSITFPCLRSSLNTGSVVMFTGRSVGFVLHPGTTMHDIGHYSTEWHQCDDPSVWLKCSITLTSKD